MFFAIWNALCILIHVLETFNTVNVSSSYSIQLSSGTTLLLIPVTESFLIGLWVCISQKIFETFDKSNRIMNCFCEAQQMLQYYILFLQKSIYGRQINKFWTLFLSDKYHQCIISWTHTIFTIISKF